MTLTFPWRQMRPPGQRPSSPSRSSCATCPPAVAPPFGPGKPQRVDLHVVDQGLTGVDETRDVVPMLVGNHKQVELPARCRDDVAGDRLHDGNLARHPLQNAAVDQDVDAVIARCAGVADRQQEAIAEQLLVHSDADRWLGHGGATADARRRRAPPSPAPRNRWRPNRQLPPATPAALSIEPIFVVDPLADRIAHRIVGKIDDERRSPAENEVAVLLGVRRVTVCAGLFFEDRRRHSGAG